MDVVSKNLPVTLAQMTTESVWYLKLNIVIQLLTNVQEKKVITEFYTK